MKNKKKVVSPEPEMDDDENKNFDEECRRLEEFLLNSESAKFESEKFDGLLTPSSDDYLR